MARDQVVYQLFSKLICDDGDGAAWLYVLNARGAPKNLLKHNVLAEGASDFWQFFDSITRHSSAEDLAREIADEWDRVWPGLADPETDMGWKIERVIGEQRRIGLEAKASNYRKVPDFCDVGFDAESKVLSMGRLCKLAIPVPKAYELWGWGSAVAAVALPDVVASTPPALAFAPADAIDWLSLVRYRLQFVEVAAQARPKWLPAHVAVLAERLGRECESGRGLGALERLAKEIGITRQASSGLLKKHGYDAGTGKKIPAAATPFTGIGRSGKKAA